MAICGCRCIKCKNQHLANFRFIASDSMTCITHAFRATHTSVMLMGKHTIVAKRAIIFNPENSLVFSLSVPLACLDVQSCYELGV